MHIREYKEEDKEECLKIFKSNMPKYFDPTEYSQFEQYLEERSSEGTKKSPYYVLEDKDKVMGCGGIYHDLPSGQVGLAWGMVLNDKHGNGYGRALLDFRLDKLKELHPQVPWVCDTTQHTYPFFEKFGFEVIQVWKDFYGK